MSPKQKKQVELSPWLIAATTLHNKGVSSGSKCTLSLSVSSKTKELGSMMLI